MESAEDKFREFAIAFWKTSRQGLERAEDSLREGYYSYAVFHSQQCVEKVIKALLEMEKIFVRDHDVSDLFATFILKKEKDKNLQKNFYRVLDILDWFRGVWVYSRYPIVREGRVISPLDAYSMEDAENAVEKAKFVFEIITDILKKRYGLRVG